MNNATKGFCPACKGELRENANFCPQCGKKLDLCPNCGELLESGYKFCQRCGAKRAGDQDQTEVAQPRFDEQKLVVTSRQVAYSDLKGCSHSERPKTKSCSRCGSGLCYECAMEELIGSRVTAYSRVDTAYSQEYAFFCPSCYLERVSDSNYKLRTSSAQRSRVAPNIFNPLSYMHIGLIIGNIILFAVAIFAATYSPFEMVLFILAIPVVLDMIFYILARNAFRDFMKKKQKALRLLEEHKFKLQQV